jgi:signal transduction histidine kinase
LTSRVGGDGTFETLRKELELLRQDHRVLLDENVKLSQDVSRYRENENNHLALHKSKKTLTAQVIKVQEEERKILAEELQENLGQMLATLQLNVSIIAMEYRDHESLVDRTALMEKILAKSINIVQQISSKLRPVMLDILGLVDAIEWQAEVFKKMSGIQCRTNVSLLSRKMDRSVSSTVYWIVKEALTNVIQHSDTTIVQVDIVEKKSWLVLSVRDDGRLDLEKEKRNIQAVVIAIMIERIEAVGGTLRMSDSPGRGIALFARIPLARKEHRHAN